MPRPLLGVGPERARRVVVLRGVGIVLAVALGAVAVWLIVTSTSQKRIEIGILAGLWGLLIGAYAAFASRQQQPPAPSVPTMPAFDPAAVPGGGVLDVRPRSELLRKEEIAMRREFQARLEKVLRREVQEGLARELAGLRAEVAALRSELVEKVGGQLRLERIETTRLIGSDLEALQQQVRELKFLQSADDDETETVTTVRRSISSATRRPAAPVAVEIEDVEAEDVEAEDVEIEDVEIEDVEVEDEDVVEDVVEPEPTPAQVAEVEPAPEPEPVAEVEPEPEAASVPEPEPEPAPEPELGPVAAAADGDPFAAMPRLTPFTDFEPIVDPAAPAVAETAGRRGGGRRYREDDSEDNVLARILQRERTSSQ